MTYGFALHCVRTRAHDRNRDKNLKVNGDDIKAAMIAVAANVQPSHCPIQYLAPVYQLLLDTFSEIEHVYLVYT